MNKILILGSCGAGKSTLAKKLSQKLSLPLIGLDQCYWRPGWTRPPHDEWQKKVRELIKKDKWVMDGNYQNTLDIRVPACDTIILLDVNRFTCLWRTLKRRFLHNRADKLDNCQERIDFWLLKWVIWDYPGKGRKIIDKYLKENSDKKIIKLKSNKNLAAIDDL